MIDAHCHIKAQNSVFCSGEFLPQFYKNQEVSAFENSTSEIGLDRRFTDKIPMSQQEELFKKLLLLAKEKNKPVVLHCVHETQRMTDILKEARLEEKKALWHGFTGSEETAAILYKLGVIVSIGPLFHGNIGNIARANPLFVLETDYEGNDIRLHSSILESVYKKAEKETAMQIKDLDSHCRNVLKFYL